MTIPRNLSILAEGASSTGVLAATNGGTGIASYTIGDLLYASGTTTLSKLADVATGSVLISGGVGVAPSWSAAPTLTSITVPTVNSATSLTFQTNGTTTAMTVDTSGNVGIGTASTSTYKLNVNGVANFGIASGVYSNYADMRLETTTGRGWRMGTTSNASTLGYFYIQGSTDNFSTSFIDGLTIDTSGNVGIGTTSPAYPLQVVKNQAYSTIVGVYNNNATWNSAFRAENGTSLLEVGFANSSYGGYQGITANGAYLYSTGSAGIQITTASGPIQFFTSAGTERMRIDSSGNAILAYGASGTVTQAYQKAGSTITPWINVKTDYGAKGDNSTNDTTAINNAIAAANASAAVIFFPPGTYKVTTLNAITASGVQVIGSGRKATIISTTSATGDVFTFQGQFQVIQSLSFSPSVFRTSGYEIAIKYGAFQQIVRDVYIEFGYNGIYNIDASETIFENIQLRYMTGMLGFNYTGTVTYGSYGMRAKNLLTDNPYVTSVFNANLKGNFAGSTAYSLSDIYIANGWIWQVTTAGTSAASAPAAPTTTSWYTTSVTNGSTQVRAICNSGLYWFIQDNYAYSLTILEAAFIDGYGGFRMQDTANTGTSYPKWAWLYNVETDHAYSVGFDLVGGLGINGVSCWIGSTLTGNGIQFGSSWTGEGQLTACRIEGNGQAGILVNGGIDVKISDSFICDNSINSAAYNGITIANNVTRFTIQNNTTGVSVFSGTTQQVYGIYVGTGSDYFNIIGNLGKGNTGANLLNSSSTGPNKIVANNN